MRVVVYDLETGEPLTVIALPAAFAREIEKGARAEIVLPCFRPRRTMVLDDGRPITPYCRIRLERHGSVVIGLTEHPLAALLTQSTFLPGQQEELLRLLR